MTLQEKLLSLRDESYAAFQSRLTPNVAPSLFIGVRVPLVRKLAKEAATTEEAKTFLSALPHVYYDENMLHGLLSEEKDFDRCIAGVDAFLPYVDNWAVCDIMSPRVFSRHKKELLEKIKEWTLSSHPYTSRFGMEMLMSHFLDGEFVPAYLAIPLTAKGEDYYVKMMQAWFFATALAKQWDAALPYLQNGTLDTWTHNKTIQKAKESYRITQAQKDLLSLLKR